VADALNLPFADNSFDLVWSLESGEHMPGKEAHPRPRPPQRGSASPVRADGAARAGMAGGVLPGAEARRAVPHGYLGA